LPAVNIVSAVPSSVICGLLNEHVTFAGSAPQDNCTFCAGLYLRRTKIGGGLSPSPGLRVLVERLELEADTEPCIERTLEGSILLDSGYRRTGGFQEVGIANTGLLLLQLIHAQLCALVSHVE